MSQFIGKSTITKVAPAVYTDDKSENASEIYQGISTYKVLEQLSKYGWEPTDAGQAYTKKQNQSGYAYHYVRLQNRELKINDGNNYEIIVTNSHDAKHSLSLNFGIFRLVCSNGLVLGDNIIEPIRLVHVGKTLEEQVKDAVVKIAEDAKTALNFVNKTSSIKTTKKIRVQLARESFIARTKKQPTEKQIDQLLYVNRPEDESDDLYTCMNVIQENLVKGNYEFDIKKVNAGSNKKFVKYASYKAKPITSIKRRIEVNKQITSITKKIANS